MRIIGKPFGRPYPIYSDGKKMMDRVGHNYFPIAVTDDYELQEGEIEVSKSIEFRIGLGYFNSYHDNTLAVPIYSNDPEVIKAINCINEHLREMYSFSAGIDYKTNEVLGVTVDIWPY